MVISRKKLVTQPTKNGELYQQKQWFFSRALWFKQQSYWSIQEIICQNTWILLLNWYESMIWAAKVEDGLSWFIKEAWVVEAIKWLGPFTQQRCGLQPTSTDNSNSLYPKFEGLHTSPRMVWMDGWVKSCLYQWLGLLWKAIFRSKLTNWMVQ